MLSFLRSEILSMLTHYCQCYKTTYYTVFDSLINYANVVWAENFNAVNRVFILQKEALKIISFQS